MLFRRAPGAPASGLPDSRFCWGERDKLWNPTKSCCSERTGGDLLKRASHGSPATRREHDSSCARPASAPRSSVSATGGGQMYVDFDTLASSRAWMPLPHRTPRTFHRFPEAFTTHDGSTDPNRDYRARWSSRAWTARPRGHPFQIPFPGTGARRQCEYTRNPLSRRCRRRPDSDAPSQWCHRRSGSDTAPPGVAMRHIRQTSSSSQKP